jgi:hypothetical protein
MPVQAIGGVAATSTAAPVGVTDPTRRAGDATESKDSTVVISRVTRTRDDGSTVTTITYADGHTKVETTPAKFSATEKNPGQGDGNQAQGQGSQAGEGRVTGVNILA